MECACWDVTECATMHDRHNTPRGPSVRPANALRANQAGTGIWARTHPLKGVQKEGKAAPGALAGGGGMLLAGSSRSASSW